MNQYEFTHNGVRYVSAEPLAKGTCKGCAFEHTPFADRVEICDLNHCEAYGRPDKREVIFIREPALDAHLQTDLVLPVVADPPPAPQPTRRIVNIGTAQQDEQPLTLEQRVAALEQAFARRITAGTADQLRQLNASHLAPGQVAEAIAKPTHVEKTIQSIAEMPREHQIGLMEGYLIQSVNAYFAARPTLDFPINRNLYEAAYKRGWQDRGEMA